jgi:2-phospho-L-lactate guanylyltransferase (CobY/MobA/RfbA family)
MAKNFSKDKKMKVLDQMLEMGAIVRTSFHSVSSKKEAKAIIEKFTEMMDVSYQEYDTYFSITDLDTPIDLAVHFKLSKEEQREALVKQIAEIDGYMVEDVNLTGSDLEEGEQIA